MQSPSLNLSNEIVRAGAGAGKTTLLTKRIFDFLTSFYEQNGQWPRIVATTFTKKATQELKERLLLKALESENFELIDYINNSSGLFISTIHGVLNRFLQSYGYLAGIEPGFDVLSEGQSNIYMKKVLRDIILDKNFDLKPITESFTFNQIIKIISSFNKSYNIEQSDGFINLNNFENNFNIKKNNLTNNIKQISNRILNEIDNEKWVTFAKSFIKLSDLDCNNGLEYSEALKNIGSKPRKGKGIPEDINADLADCLKFIKGEFAKAAYQQYFWKRTSNLNSLFEKLYVEFSDKYNILKSNSSFIEINDLEIYAHKLIKDKPELASLFSKQWDYWLIDEYQDTSPIQVEILDILVGDSPSFIVGDPQQSIYLFRGARSEVFDFKQKKIKNQNGSVNFLKKNYRSAPELLLFFNDFFSKIGSQFESMNPKDGVINSSKLVAQIACLPVLEGDAVNPDQNEINFIIENIINLVNQGVSFDDICVLSKTNKYLSKISQELKKYNIPINLYSAAGFSSRREIIDALMFLKFLVNPYDDTNLIGLLRTPWFYIADTELVGVLTNRKKGVWPLLKEKLESHLVVQKLVTCIKSSYEYGVTKVFKDQLLNSEFLDYSLEYDSTGRRESNFWKLIQKLSEAERKPGFNYIEFINSIVGGIDADLLSDEGDAVAALEPNCINLMTVHASKGLQFKHVFIPGAHKKPSLQISSSRKEHFVYSPELKKWSLYAKSDEDLLSPTLFHIDYVKELEARELLESQRLLYVALTRASEQIYLSFLDKIEPNSWASFIPIEEPGLKKKESYSYYFISDPIESVESQLINKKKNKNDIIIDKIKINSTLKNKNKSKISVSEVLNKGVVKNDSKNESEVQDSFLAVKKANEGTVLHKIFELLKFHDDSKVKTLVPDLFPANTNQVIKSIDYILSLKEPSLLNIIKNGNVEWGFQLNADEGLIEGQIDLWGEYNGETWIVDYKSGSEVYKDKAFEQLEYYAKAVKEVSENKKINLLVVYPLSEKIYSKSLNV